MILTRENYHSPEAKQLYMGASQFKDFAECEARALRNITAEQEDKTAFMQGHYFDSLFEGNSDLWLAQNSKVVYKKTGGLYAEFETVQRAYDRVSQDPEFMRLSSGQQQVIMTGKIQGVPVKIMIDSLLPDEAMVDRKLMADFKDKWQNGEYVPWWKTYRYDIQAAIYSYIYEQNTGERLPFIFCAATKEKTTDYGIFKVTEETYQAALGEVMAYIEHFDDVKQGRVTANACGVCDYCKGLKKYNRGECEEI